MRRIDRDINPGRSLFLNEFMEAGIVFYSAFSDEHEEAAYDEAIFWEAESGLFYADAHDIYLLFLTGA